MNSHVRFCLKMIENILTYEFNTYRLVDIISYVFFSSGTNRHRKELFVMAVRTPSGKTFPGNFSIIPSAKKIGISCHFPSSFFGVIWRRGMLNESFGAD